MGRQIFRCHFQNTALRSNPRFSAQHSRSVFILQVIMHYALSIAFADSSKLLMQVFPNDGHTSFSDLNVIFLRK